jgi:hypothetical protein
MTKKDCKMKAMLDLAEKAANQSASAETFGVVAMSCAIVALAISLLILFLT